MVIARAAVLARDDDALEHLQAFLGLRLLDTHMHAHRIPGLKIRDALAQLRVLNSIQAVHDF
jgi:hypothetical protein